MEAEFAHYILFSVKFKVRNLKTKLRFKKKKRYGSLGLGASMDGPEIPLFVHCGNMFAKGM